MSPITSVPETRLVSTSTVLTHVQGCVVLMPLVRLTITEHCADAIQDTLEMHLFHVKESQPVSYYYIMVIFHQGHCHDNQYFQLLRDRLSVQTRVTHLHVVPMRSVQTETVPVLAHVSKTTLAIPTLLAVQNAQLTLIVLQIRPAGDCIVLTRVQDCVELMPNAGS